MQAILEIYVEYIILKIKYLNFIYSTVYLFEFLQLLIELFLVKIMREKN